MGPTSCCRPGASPRLRFCRFDSTKLSVFCSIIKLPKAREYSHEEAGAHLIKTLQCLCWQSSLQVAYFFIYLFILDYSNIASIQSGTFGHPHTSLTSTSHYLACARRSETVLSFIATSLWDSPSTLSKQEGIFGVCSTTIHQFQKRQALARPFLQLSETLFWEEALRNGNVLAGNGSAQGSSLAGGGLRCCLQSHRGLFFHRGTV